MNEESKAGKLQESEKRSSAPSISLPKGGGAIRGIGEKFAANPVTGTGSLSVPIATSPGRSGFGPQLSLSYDSGSGNGPFGLGWNLSLPSITRKTDKGLPKYQDADESDTFILSGAEDLVPVLKKQGNDWVPEDIPDRTIDTDTYQIQRYRPRIEGLFARIERWTNVVDPSDMHWRSISKDNILTIYGKDSNSRIANPKDPRRIFSWLICETRDDKGNAVIYEYKPEDGAGINLTSPHERNRGGRDDPRRTANRYLKHIRYGNRISLLNNDGQRPRSLTEVQVQNAGWMFEVVSDYGEHDANVPKPDDPDQWDFRDDPFSTYRAGFEVRTTRLCQRVLMFHHFPDEEGVGNDCLVRSTDFTYSHEQDPANVRNPVYSFLCAVTQIGYKREGDGYLKGNLPSVEFEYTQPVVQDTVEEVDPESLENLPMGVDGSSYQWTDLHGEGIPGILTEQADAWFYKRNISPIGKHPVEFAPLECVTAKPNMALAKGARFMDLAGDGQLDLVVFDDPTPGLYEHDTEEGWQPFRPFTSRLNRDTRDPNLKFVDLDGDGHADVFISEDDAFVWHASLAEEGFGPARRVAKALDEEKGPRLVFADGTQSIYLADLSGDGLTDLVRMRNGEICYWPNLGYGRFGNKISMDHAPTFDNPDQFDQKRIRLADIDGSGVTDIIYLKGDGVYIYLNESGNRWADAEKLKSFPHIDNLSSVIAVDLLGNGTACLVWSSPLPGHARKPMRYIDLMGGQKPHLLVKTVNNLGAETHVHYAPSTKFYLADKAAGKPWITKIPFPVHVVERVETFDRISRNRFVTRYAYHHGYFDGSEREFRGFGMVEQWDTEEYAALTQSQDFPTGDNIEESSHVPPVRTKTWFHTGAYLGSSHISNFFAGLLDANDIGEYYREPGLDDTQARELLLDDTILPDGLTAEEEREACRALKGSMLRQEVYALDGTDKEPHPYTVTEQNFTVRCLQSREDNRHGVFFTHAREAINYHYERNPADPRIAHAMTLEVDKYGNVLKTISIAYGRRETIKVVEEDGSVREIQNPKLNKLDSKDQEKQTQPLITYTENDVTNAIDKLVTDPGYDPDNYRTPLPWEVRTYELTGLTPENGVQPFSFNELTKNNFKKIRTLQSVPYETATDYAVKRKRLIECFRTLYRKNDLTGFLNAGVLESMALPGESYKLAFTPGLIDKVYERNGQKLIPDPDAMLKGSGGDKGGYVDLDQDQHWWIQSGSIFFSQGSNDNAAAELAYARQHFFMPHRYRDPFHTNAAPAESLITYDNYKLLFQESRDALGNLVTAGERKPDGLLDKQGNNYRVLQPEIMMDPNRNCSHVAFDALGMVVGTAVMAKPEDNYKPGDSLEDFEPDLTEKKIIDHIAHPLGRPNPPLKPHDILEKATTRLVYDPFAYHRTKNDPEPQPSTVYTIARETHASDLAGNEKTIIQHSFSYSDGFGREIQMKIQAEPEKINGIDGPPRWVGSGWTIFNNKGKPVRQYEPFFDDTHKFRFGKKVGVSAILFYDPIERVVATLHPNHTYEKVVFDPWRQETWDVNDTVLQADPKNDPDVGDFFRRLPDAEYLPTWHAQRQGGAMGVQEQAAAAKAAVHANTSTVAYFDTLGRPFLTVAHNRFVWNGSTTDEKYSTRIELDIEGNQRKVIDAKGRVVMRYDYSMAGPAEEEDAEETAASNGIHQASMEAGERWMLNDVAGNPIYAWDSRGHQFRTEYDKLRRPVRAFVKGADPQNPGKEILYEKTEYGEGQANDTQLNLRTQVFRLYDGAGIVTNMGHDPVTNQDEAYDFKGNLLHNSRQLAVEYKNTLDWSAAVPLEAETYANHTTYDALSRPVSLTTPDSSVIRPTYNETNLLEHIEANLRSSATATTFVKDIDYDAEGQRTSIEYGNGVKTEYEYDRKTFRLIHLFTSRGAAFPNDCPNAPNPPCGVQNLHYTYDPVGNITHIRDDAQQTIFFKNQKVEPSAEYTYDAVYRLIEAKGREHLGQAGGGSTLPPKPTSHTDSPRVGLLHPVDGKAMGRYLQQYVYDEVGNFLEMNHSGTNPVDPGWKRDYSYSEPSLLEPGNPGKQNNRLTSTQIGSGPAQPYTYDKHGNMTAMPHLSVMRWDFQDQLQATAQQVVNNGTPEMTYYVYDADGERVRKVTERQAPAGQTPTRMKERIYLGGFEIYREYKGNGTTVSIERETLHVMDDEQRIALVETRTRTQGVDALPEPLIRYQFGNHLGSASVELDDKARIISYEEYYPYGSTSYQAVGNQTETPKRYRYTGKERDEESGLYYHGARYYAPWLGRWTACDPAGFVDGFNLYFYVRMNPIVHRDDDGQETDINLWAKYESRQKAAQAALARKKRLQGKRYVFNAKGVYIRTEATGSNKISTIIMLPAKGAKGGKMKEFAFHDPVKDILAFEKAIKDYAGRQLVVPKTNEDIQKHLKRGRIPMKSGGPAAWRFALAHSNAGYGSGRMDFLVTQLPSEPLPSSTGRGRRGVRDCGSGAIGERPGLFLFEGKAYNTADFGNLLWGAAMARLGVSEWFSQSGAHINEFHRLGDDSADQRAIETGHRSQTKHDASKREEQWRSWKYRSVAPGQVVDTRTGETVIMKGMLY